MERPALQCLLADIGKNLIDVVVVYKVDRLTRSLTDFARLVEIFESHEIRLRTRDEAAVTSRCEDWPGSAQSS
jgi:DNA invertase Pin-like site-specific DNA recombinase